MLPLTASEYALLWGLLERLKDRLVHPVELAEVEESRRALRRVKSGPGTDALLPPLERLQRQLQADPPENWPEDVASWWFPRNPSVPAAEAPAGPEVSRKGTTVVIDDLQVLDFEDLTRTMQEQLLASIPTGDFSSTLREAVDSLLLLGHRRGRYPHGEWEHDESGPRATAARDSVEITEETAPHDGQVTVRHFGRPFRDALGQSLRVSEQSQGWMDFVVDVPHYAGVELTVTVSLAAEQVELLVERIQRWQRFTRGLDALAAADKRAAPAPPEPDAPPVVPASEPAPAEPAEQLDPVFPRVEWVQERPTRCVYGEPILTESQDELVVLSQPQTETTRVSFKLDRQSGRVVTLNEQQAAYFIGALQAWRRRASALRWLEWKEVRDAPLGATG